MDAKFDVIKQEHIVTLTIPFNLTILKNQGR